MNRASKFLFWFFIAVMVLEGAAGIFTFLTKTDVVLAIPNTGYLTVAWTDYCLFTLFGTGCSGFMAWSIWEEG